MSNKNGYKKVVHWVITDEKIGTQFEDFQKISIMKGKNPFEYLSEQVFRITSLEKPISFTLITEPELIKELTNRNISITRSTLNKWRNNNTLELDFHWFTDGRNVVYNMEESIEIIQRLKI